MNQRTAGVNLRAGNALHHGVGPAHQAFGGDGDHRLLHGVEHGGQLLAAAFDLGKALAQALGGLVQCGFHGGEFIPASPVEAGAQVALRRCAARTRPRARAAR